MELIQAKGDTWYLAAAELIPIYRLEGGRCILLDSGLESEREALSAALDRAGLTPVGVFGSHTHRDHSVNNGWLRERYGTRICRPAGEARSTVRRSFWGSPSGCSTPPATPPTTSAPSLRTECATPPT